ncbi:epoxide hydrolase 3-like isoform X1 [Silene latifolia]|uniref:epoxide hydrolase 3-like isoform X1 n=1 Tax=Silene latifolia TaxID=37657 RepID=UPI003D776DFB
MEQIQHKHVSVRGLNLHVAEAGTGSEVVVFLHGFPEIWYSWRHQMVAVAKAGYRAIAIDFRGYGLSEQPAEPEKATMTDFVEDVIGLLDSLGINKVFLVGKDFGAFIVSMIAVLHKERVAGILTLGIPFMLPGFGNLKPDQLPKGFYVLRWKEPGRAEVDFGRFDVKTVIRNIYILFSGSELQVASDDQEIMDLVPPNAPLPPWFSEDDLSVYANLYETSGFRTALQVPYRSIDTSVDIEDPKVTAPALLIMGEKDYVFKFPGMEEYIRGGMVKTIVPDLEITYMPEGNHFVQEQFPEEVNRLIVSFLNKHTI